MFGGDRGASYLCEGGNGGLSLRKKSVMLRQIRAQLRTLVMEDYQVANWFFTVVRACVRVRACVCVHACICCVCHSNA
jgi:hypothetical protein